MKCRYIYIFIAFLIVLTVNNNLVFCQDISVIHADGSIQAHLKTTLFNQYIRYISITDFAELFNSRSVFNEQNKKMTIYLGNKPINVTAYNPFIIIGDDVYQLPIDTKWKDEQVFVPRSSFLEIIERVFPDQISYNRKTDLLKIIIPLNIPKPNVNDIEIEEKINGTLLKISTTKNFRESDLSLRVRHSWLYLDIYGGRVDSSALYAEFNSGMISRIVPSQISDELAQIGFRLRDEVVEKQLIIQNPKNILVSIKTQKDLSKEITKTLEREKKKWLIDRIVIDPGHGGRDPGAIGPQGSYEKNVVLSIAKYLKQYLENETEIDVLLTRENDRFVELEERTEFANRHEAKLFISIHANSNPSRWLTGVSTYFQGPDNTEEAREVARLENSVIKYERESKYADLSQEQYILSAVAQNVYNKESEDLAAMVQQDLIKECSLADRRVRQASFYVL